VDLDFILEATAGSEVSASRHCIQTPRRQRVCPPRRGRAWQTRGRHGLSRVASLSLPDVHSLGAQLGRSELEVVDGSRLQIADRVMSLSRYGRYRRRGLLMSNFYGALYVDVPSDTVLSRMRGR
jgi:hypothetical protein